MVLHFLQCCGIDIQDHSAIAQCIKQTGALSASVHNLRQQLMAFHGAEAAVAAWESHIAACGGLNSLSEGSNSTQERWRWSSDGWVEWGMDASREAARRIDDESTGLIDLRRKWTSMLLAWGCLRTRCAGLLGRSGHTCGMGGW